ncbi:MAG: ATP synthase F1 subunit delta [Roseburia sp.]|nr:ATP synthase F1 subunit delta [Roseburia sp.]
MAKLVSKTYGDALFEAARESGRLDDFWVEAKAIKTALQENPEFFQLMEHPKIGEDEKIKIMEHIFSGKVSPEMVGLLCMIMNKGHFREAGAVLDYFIDRVKEHRAIGTAYVTTAMELTKAGRKAVEKRLLETTKYVKFEMHYAVDPGLIGGMVIRIGDRVVDSSVKTKLYNLTRELSKR